MRTSITFVPFVLCIGIPKQSLTLNTVSDDSGHTSSPMHSTNAESEETPYAMENEIWKDIPGYEGLYQASSLGRIKRLSRICDFHNSRDRLLEEQIISIATHKKSGYQSVSLSKSKRKRSFNVHRLLAASFHDMAEGKNTVNHINHIKTDNRAVNLEWCTQRENNWKCVEAGRARRAMGASNPNSKLTNAQAMEVREKYIFGVYGFVKLSRDYGVSTSVIERIIKNKAYFH